MSDLDRSSIPRTRWFSLSGKELLALAVGVALVLGAAGIIRGIDWLWGRREVAVKGAVEALPQPLRLNLNTAQTYELSTLPGIGPKTAEALVRHRNRNGPFRNWEDVMQVSGIGPKTVEGIRPHAMCGPAEPTAGEEESDG